MRSHPGFWVHVIASPVNVDMLLTRVPMVGEVVAPGFDGRRIRVLSVEHFKCPLVTEITDDCEMPGGAPYAAEVLGESLTSKSHA